MAAKTSAASGVVSATGTWTGGVVPVEGDTVVIQSGHTVTMDQDWTIGDDTATAALRVASGGKFEWKSDVAANYTLTLKGDFDIDSGGTVEIGTVANPIPNTRTATIKLNKSASGSDGKYGWIIDGTLTMQGASRTYWQAKLAADVAASGTTLTTDVSTGWKSGDVIAIATTNRTATECESRTLSIDASGTTVTVSSGVTNAHLGTSPTQAEVVLLTRNIVVTVDSTANVSYLNIGATATVDIDWVEFSYLGENASGKYGISIGTTTGSCSIKYSSVHDTEDYGIYITSDWDYVTLQYLALYNCNTSLVSGSALRVTASTIYTTGTIADITCIGGGPGSSGTSHGLNIGYPYPSLANLTMAGWNGGTSSAYAGISISVSTANAMWDYPVDVGDVTVHGCTSTGLYIQAPGLSFSNVYSWRNNTYGIYSAAGLASTLKVSGGKLFGNASAGIGSTGIIDGSFSGLTIAGDSSFGQAYGIATITVYSTIATFNSCTFGVATGIYVAHSTADIQWNNGNINKITLNNCKCASTTEVNAKSAGLSLDSYVRSSDHDQVSNSFSTYRPFGVITSDDTIAYGGVGRSCRLTPNSASNKLESGVRKAAVASGNTLTISVFVRKSSTGDGAGYNGNNPRLVAKQKDRLGFTNDSVMDTMTVGTGEWEQLTGTTSAVSVDGIAEFVVDCDGTAGWINIDQWQVS